MPDDSHVVIGTATRGVTLAAPIALTPEDRRQHIHIVGASGSGKSNLLRRLVFAQLAASHDQNRQGFLLLDPLGPLADSIVDAVPEAWNDRTIYFSPGEDPHHWPAFNPLDRVPEEKHHLTADHVVACFMHVWGANLEDTPRLLYLLYHGVRLLLCDPDGATLLGLTRVYLDDDYRARLLRKTPDAMVLNFWDNEFARYDDRFRAQVLSSLQNKIGMLLAPPALRLVLAQRRSTIDIPRLMDTGGAMICNLSKGRLGSLGSSLIGALLVTAVAQAAQERMARSAGPLRPFSLIADEVQNFSTSAFATVLSELRNGALQFVGAHQFLRQLSHEVQDAIIANCSTTIVFRVGDADRLAEKLGIINAEALTDTGNFSAWVKLMRGGIPSEPFLVAMLPAEPPAHGRKQAVVAHTRARHTRGRGAVEKEIRRQLLG